MITISRRTSALAAAALAAAAFGALVTPASATPAAQDTFCFAKHAVAPGAWVGTYAAASGNGSCDAAGGLPMTSHLTSTPVPTGQVLHITIQWQFLDAEGGLAFQTDQRGLLKLGSGDVVLNGVVTDGARVGARTHDEGSPTDTVGSYAGIMRLQ